MTQTGLNDEVQVAGSGREHPVALVGAPPSSSLSHPHGLGSSLRQFLTVTVTVVPVISRHKRHSRKEKDCLFGGPIS